MAKHDGLIEELVNDDRYEIRSDGTIWRKLKKGLKRTGLARNSSGYRFVAYKGAELRVHRVIYRKFVGPLTPGLLVDHIDGNVDNNTPENLQELTNAENLRKRKNRKLTLEKVNEIRERYAAGNVTQQRLADEFGVAQPTITKIVKGRIWR